MAVVKRLPDGVASRIAAGEVIERPASVLKELLENAVDAGASRVDVESTGAGRTLLRVADDGRGMDPADCRAAFERHATSKIESLEDIDRLSTFGFRGEALYAIAAVSRTTLTSSLSGSRRGWRVEMKGSKLVAEREAPPVRGTVVEVADLFFNTPARLKFLKSDASEKAHLTAVVEEAALANPGVSFRYRSEGRSALDLPAKGGADARAALRERVREVMGAEGEGLLEALHEGPGLRLSAFVSPADRLAASRSLQTFFVNRRPVASAALRQALYRAYEPFRSRSRHPVAVVFAEVPPADLDVNVHPAKREVRFRSDRAVFEALAQAVSRALLGSKGLPRMETPAPVVVYSPAAAGATVAADLPYRAAPSAPAAVEPDWFGPKARYLGQIERAYLVFEEGGGLLMVDQHAAQERILFERYLAEVESGSPLMQSLMLPIPVELPASRVQRVLARRERLRAYGFEVEPFGKTTLQVTGVPSLFHAGGEVQEMVHRLLDHLVSAGSAAADVRYHATATIACKAAVKAHDPLGEREALRLLADLRTCKDGSCCPHGRPATFSLDREELARRFKRPGAPPL